MIEIKKFVVGSLETNCYLIYSKATKVGFLIDPGAFDKRISDAITKDSIRVKNIINTHGHIDHIAGNGKFGYPILIHEYDRDFLRDPMKNLSFSINIISPSPPAARLLKDEDVIEEGNMAFEVIHTPGHTPGSISLKLGSRIFTGDALFRESIGRTDLPGADEKTLLDSIRYRLMVFTDEIEILPGHGPNSTIGYERKNNPFLIHG